MTTTSIPPVIGRYEVVGRIGGGETATLYRAWDPQRERPIAIKILIADDEELRERFKRDACSVAHLRHPHLVTIFDAGEHDGRPFIAMEYVQGRTLADLIGSHEPISTLRKLQWMQELCEGLAFAHDSGLIHRDITSANIMVDGNGTLKILHFGIAPFAPSTTTTQAGAPIDGSSHMAAAHVTGESADARSDTLAVGAVFYELLSGRPAFVSSLESHDPLMHFEPEPLESLLPGIDPDIVGIVRQCLEKDSSRRYPSLDAMRNDFRRALVHLQSADEPDTDAAERPRRVSAELIHAPEPTRRVLDREELARRRNRQIQLHLERAEQALSAGDYDAGIDACEEVLLLDAENAQALDLMDRARTALDQCQAEDWLGEAEKEIQRGALSTAIALVDSAATLAPWLSRVADVRRTAEEAIRERERGRQRAEHERRARDIVREAKQAFGAGNREEALQMLARFEPPHDLVTHAAEQLRAEADRIAEQKRLETEHRARQQRITAEVAIAREEISQEQFADAVDRLRSLQEAEGQSSEIAEAIAAAEAGQAEADRKAARQRELAEHVARAAGLLARNNAAAAISRVEAALAIDPHYTPAVALKAKVEDALQRIAQRREIEERLAREREQAIASAIETAQRATAHDEGIAALTEALDLDPDHVVAQQPLEQRREALAHEQADEQPRQENDRGRREQLRLLVGSARPALNQADLDTARDLTRQALDPDSESVDTPLRLERIGPLEEFEAEHPSAAVLEHQTLRRDDSRAIKPVRPEPGANASVMPQPRMSDAAASESVTSRPAPATAIADLRRARSLGRWMRAAALGAVAVAGSVYYVTSSRPSSQVEGTVTLAAAPVTLESSVPAPTPPVAAETPALGADREAELDRHVGELHTRARQAFGRGDWQAGFIAVAEAARLRPDDAASKVILADALQDTRTRVTGARDAARAAGVSDRSPRFRAADQKRREGERLARGGKTNEGIRALWETVGLFEIARAEADKSRERPELDVSGRKDAPVARTDSLSVPTPPAPELNTSATSPEAESTANRLPVPTPTPTAAPPPAASPATPPAEEASPERTAGRSGGTASLPLTGDRLSVTATANAPFSPAAAVAQERPGIQTMLEAYASGYSTLDAAAIRRIYPGIDENGLRRRFGAYRSQQVQVQVEQIQMTGPTTAEVSALQTTTASMQVGGPQRDTRRIVFRLEKRNGSWIILEHR